MRNKVLLLLVVLGGSYGYGVISHAHRLFPMGELSALRRVVWPERGIATTPGVIYSDTSERQEVACNSLAEDAAVILVMGQSNAANYGETLYRPRRQVFNFDWKSGRCYRAEDPLLGASGRGGSAWSRLGDALIERGVFRRVVLVPVAVGGTSIHAWVGENGPAGHAVKAAAGLREQGLSVSHVLWQQGESDRNMDKSVYIRLFSQMNDYLRTNGIEAPIFVAQATICNNHGLEDVRQAQAELPLLMADSNVLPGPDIDTLDHIYQRASNLCHFSDQGLAGVAELWLEVLAQHQVAATQATPAASQAAVRPAP